MGRDREGFRYQFGLSGPRSWTGGFLCERDGVLSCGVGILGGVSGLRGES